MEITLQQQVEKIIIRMVMDSPFFGELAIPYTLPGRIIEDYTHPTAWTDGRRMGINPDWFMGSPEDEQTYIVAHEVFHPLLLHHIRRGTREHRLWNVAGDYEINCILDAAKIGKGPVERLHSKQFAGMATEEIYPVLYQLREEQKKKKTQQGESSPEDELSDESTDEKGFGKRKEPPKENDADDDGGDDGDQDQGTPKEDDYKDLPDVDVDDYDEIPDLTSDEEDIGGTGTVRDAVDSDTDQGLTQEQKEQLERDYKIAVAQAAQNAKTIGKLPLGIERLVKDLLQPELDWQELLGIWLAEHCAKSDYTWIPPNRAFVGAGIYVPALVSDGEQHLVIAIDTSCSIRDDMLNRATTETCSVLEYWNVTLHTVFCDAAVQGEPQTWTKQDYPITLEPKGGGGTDFTPVFDWIAEQDWKPVGLVYITDLEGRFPSEIPEYPVLWLCHYEPRIFYKAFAEPFGPIVVMK
jgi:predicted metal-dependent peptidase